jgi:hypothetical protein
VLVVSGACLTLTQKNRGRIIVRKSDSRSCTSECKDQWNWGNGNENERVEDRATFWGATGRRWQAI